MENVKENCVTMCQVTNQITLNAAVTTVIPRGFAIVPGQNPAWQISIDRHALKAVFNRVTVPGTAFVNNGSELIDTMVNLYQVSIVGVLYYNFVTGPFTAVNPIFTDRTTSFSASGSIPVNVVIGYVSDPGEIRPDIINNLIFTVILQNPTIVVNGETIVYDPANPTVFFGYFNGLNDITFNTTVNITISNTPIISQA